MYVLNFLHVERWHIFEVVNHGYNVIFKYNVILYRSDKIDEMSSPNRTTNDMYEDIREGTSGTRNEGNNYNILLTYIENIKIELYLKHQSGICVIIFSDTCPTYNIAMHSVIQGMYICSFLLMIV